MTRLEKHRRAGVLAATVAAGVLGMAAPAAADATVSPPSAPQGSGQNVTFQVTNTGQSPLTRVKVTLPKELPVAEVYPLSVDDWAPLLDPIELATPLTTIHGGSPVSETAGAVTWIAMPGKALAPGKTAELPVSMGPMPVNGTQMTFTFEPTYAEPAKGAPIPPVTLALTPALPGQTAGHGGHGGTDTAATGTDAVDEAMFAALAEAEDSGPGFWTIGGWVVAALAAIGAAVAVMRARRSPRTAESGLTVSADDGATGTGDEGGKELAAAGAGKPRVTSWRYQDGPEE